MIEFVLSAGLLGTSLAAIALALGQRDLISKHESLYKDFHELNLFVRGVLSLPESERPKPAKKVTVEDLYGGSKTRRAIDEAVTTAATTWRKSERD
jgi:hypothetical protein